MGALILADILLRQWAFQMITIFWQLLVMIKRFVFGMWIVSFLKQVVHLFARITIQIVIVMKIVMITKTFKVIVIVRKKMRCLSNLWNNQCMAMARSAFFRDFRE